MFCNYVPEFITEPHYNVVDLNNNEQLIINSNNTVKQFLEQNELKNNIWKRIQVTNNTYSDCFGNQLTFGIGNKYNTIYN